MQFNELRRASSRRLKNANRPSRVRLVLRCAFNRLREMFGRLARPQRSRDGPYASFCLDSLWAKSQN
jgi:hypothetical protein